MPPAGWMVVSNVSKVLPRSSATEIRTWVGKLRGLGESSTRPRAVGEALVMPRISSDSPAVTLWKAFIGGIAAPYVPPFLSTVYAREAARTPEVSPCAPHDQ